jgi:hypothetical protein
MATQAPGDFYYSGFDEYCGILHESSRFGFTEHPAQQRPTRHPSTPYGRCVISRLERATECLSLSFSER